MSLLRKILSHRKHSKKMFFTTPTHSQGEFIEDISENFLGSKVFNCDFSEIDGFDNLREPCGVIKDLYEKLCWIYKSKATFILTNGSSSGIMAAMLATIKENDKVIVARNCHVSVCNGLILTGARPVWVMPKYNQEWGIYEEVTVESIENAIAQNPDAKAIIITSPTYEGVFSDIKSIAAAAQAAGIKLIVDEAHGALLNFGNFKSLPAIHLGADISVNSLHKTAGSLTPAGLLHIRPYSSVNTEDIQDALNILNTTSPSYPLMVSVEATVLYLNSEKGRAYIRRLQKNIKANTKNFLKNSRLKVYDGFNDPTKILFKVDGVSGMRAASYLNNSLNIEEEYSNAKSMLFITGIGTSKWKLLKLFWALSKMNLSEDEHIDDIFAYYNLPQQVMTPKAAFCKDKSVNIISEVCAKVAAEPVLEYPPGIPVIVPGERIDEDVMRFITKNSVKTCDD